MLADRLVEPVLQQIARWFERSGGEMTAWMVGIVGFLIARDTVPRAPEVLDSLGEGPTPGVLCIDRHTAQRGEPVQRLDHIPWGR